MIEVISEKTTEEIVVKDKDGGEKGEKDESVEVENKEKGEEKEDQALATVARDIVDDK